MKYRLYRDEYLVRSFDTYNEALVWLQKTVSYSWNHAFKHEGWRIVEVESN